jgi:hypothetical protein
VLSFLAEFRSGDQTFWNSFCHLVQIQNKIAKHLEKFAKL